MNLSTKSAALLVGASALVLLVVRKLLNDKNDSLAQRRSLNVSSKNPDHQEMDSAGLANRVLRKAETVIQGRTSRVIVVVERCTDDHNYSAIIRTAEALGIQHIWLIDPVISLTQNELTNSSSQERKAFMTENDNDEVDEDALTFEKHSDKIRYEHGKFAKRATEWITLREFQTTTDCIEALRKDNRTIWATDLSQQACCLTQEDLPFNSKTGSVIPEKLAVVMGTESVGVTEEMLAAADLRVYLPLRGFADSLNLSVAAALVIQRIFDLDPSVIGDISENEKRELRQLWFPKMVATRGGSTSVKKQLRKIAHSLREIDIIKDKVAFIKASQGKEEGENRDRHDNKYKLSEQQIEKLENENSLLRKEHELNDKIWKESEIAVQDAIINPPKPLTDVRRCDEHRTAFIGTNVRKKNESHWKGMAATANSNGTPNPDSVPKIKH